MPCDFVLNRTLLRRWTIAFPWQACIPITIQSSVSNVVLLMSDWSSCWCVEHSSKYFHILPSLSLLYNTDSPFADILCCSLSLLSLSISYSCRGAFSTTSSIFLSRDQGFRCCICQSWFLYTFGRCTFRRGSGSRRGSSSTTTTGDSRPVSLADVNNKSSVLLPRVVI